MLRVFWILTGAELRALLRARVALFWIFIFPFIFLGMMMLSYGGGGAMAGQAIIEVVDQDHSAVSADYIDTISKAFHSSDTIRGQVRVVNDDSATQDGAVRLVLPKGMAAAVAGHGEAVIKASYSSAGNISTQVAARVLDPITTRFNARLANAPMPLKIELARINQDSGISFTQYLLTGVLIMSMMSAGMNATAVTIADHRERNTFKLMSCLPLSPSAYIGAILASRVIVLVAAAAFLIACARAVFGITISMDPVRLVNAAVILMIGNLMLLSLGLALAARMSSATTAVFICNIVYLILLFFSDLTMPLSALPGNVRTILQAVPTAHFVAALRATLLQGASLYGQSGQIAIMIAWTFGALLIARTAFVWHRR